MSAEVRAVILAAGRGTRMRAAAQAPVVLDPEQERMAALGLKTLVPFHGQPFLAWMLNEVAAAGIDEACVVTGPSTSPVRDWLERAWLDRPTIRHAIQAQPLGSANALLAAEPYVRDAPFLVLNADNLYEADDLRRLVALDGPGLVCHLPSALEAGGIPTHRMRAFAIIERDADGMLRRIIEKPAVTEGTTLRADTLISMTCWRFDAAILDACRAITPSVRGELELPDAVMWLVHSGARLRVLSSTLPVLDVSTREDVPAVAELLRHRLAR